MLDKYDVRLMLSVSPEECVEKREVQAILRNSRYQFRPWYQYPSSEEISRIQNPTEKRTAQKERDRVRSEILASRHISWWSDLRNEIQRQGVPRPLANKFAYYLAGYVLVQEGEEIRSRHVRGTCYEWIPQRDLVAERDLQTGNLVKHRLKSRGKKGYALPEWRKAKRVRQALATDLGGTLPDSPKTHPPHKESLKSTLSRLMVEKLGIAGKSQAAASELVTSVWELIGESDRDSDPGTLARSVRRSRRRGQN